MSVYGVGAGRWITRFCGGGLDNLIQATNEKGYVMIEVRPDGFIDGVGSDIQRYMQSCKMLKMSDGIMKEKYMHITEVKIANLI